MVYLILKSSYAKSMVSSEGKDVVPEREGGQIE